MSFTFQNFVSSAGLVGHKWQQEAYDFCIKNEQAIVPSLGMKGGLIADEMGLGKTIVMLGLCACNQVKSTLIVLPTALIQQWHSQLTTFYEKAGIDLNVLVLYGPKAHKITEKQISEAAIVLTTYGTMSSSNAIISKRFSFKQWDRVIYDEAHHMRNTSTNSYHAAMALKSDIVWLVTGTPINNGVKDFWNIMQIIGLPDDFNRNSSEDVRDLLANFVIKRTKKKVGLDIPGVTIYNEIVPWLSQEEKTFAHNIHNMISLHCENSFEDEECLDDEVQEKQEDDYVVPERYRVLIKGQISKLPMMTRAKQSCTCPKMITDSFSSIIEGPITNSKMTYVTDVILNKNNNGRKKLVFCHFNQEIQNMYDILSKQYSVGIINGAVTGAERTSLMTSTDIDVLILQIQSCCEGLNLQQYSEIYFVSPSWNPCVEDQAIARAHRVGQTQTVDVYRFTMADFDDLESIETYAKDVQDSKRQIANELYNLM
tara:strand:- start:2870 stop:4318 length:1449 start_codon:yes stop_codon:yes gene_type:complete